MKSNPFIIRCTLLLLTAILLCPAHTVYAEEPAVTTAELLVEAESFQQHGGWKLDTQSITAIGSPYLLAHGLGKPVADATTTVQFPQVGTYRVWVRTKDWVARWNAPGAPGRFQLAINGSPLTETFGTKGAQWSWHDGGTVQIKKQSVALKLHDLTGFEGRCDTIYFTKNLNVKPPQEAKKMHAWRLKKLGVSIIPVKKGTYDLVVVGGGYAGIAAALSASRMGCKVALIQNRPVLGGNGSSEVQVWAQGLIRRGKFSRVGEIVDEFTDHAKASPGTIEEYGDTKKVELVRAEKNIDLFLNHHVEAVQMDGSRIASVTAFNTRTNQRVLFEGKLFADCSGHGVVGYLSKANWEMTPKGRMGMSNMWRWKNEEAPQSFPETPWALDLKMNMFPYPKRFHAEWFWESGFDKDPINDAEGIRDLNFRANYGAFNALKNGDGTKEHLNAKLTWMAYIGGPRESRRLLGDVVLNKEDIHSKKQFADGCVPSTWSIDLHYPKKSYAKHFPKHPFISIAVHDRNIDRQFGYPVPYRCFYSRNIENLFMAGRCISVTHEALGTVRVMKTCGMMGEVVGKAVSLCVQNDCTPRDIYKKHLKELFVLLELPGKARRETVGGSTIIPKDALVKAGARGPMPGINPQKLDGTIIEGDQIKKTGKWSHGAGRRQYVGYDYIYASGGSTATATFSFTPTQNGLHEIRISYNHHENRTKKEAVQIHSVDGIKTVYVNQQEKPPLKNGFISLGTFLFKKGQPAKVVIDAKPAKGFVCVDAIQVLPPQ